MVGPKSNNSQRNNNNKSYGTVLYFCIWEGGVDELFPMLLPKYN